MRSPWLTHSTKHTMATGRIDWNIPADYASWVYKPDTKEAFGNKYPVYLNKADDRNMFHMILSSSNILVSNNILHWCQNICKYIQVVIWHGTPKASATLFVSGNLLLKSGHWSLNCGSCDIQVLCHHGYRAGALHLIPCMFMLYVCYWCRTERDIFTRVTSLAYPLSHVLLCFCPITTITARATYEVPYQYILDVGTCDVNVYLVHISIIISVLQFICIANYNKFTSLLLHMLQNTRSAVFLQQWLAQMSIDNVKLVSTICCIYPLSYTLCTQSFIVYLVLYLYISSIIVHSCEAFTHIFQVQFINTRNIVWFLWCQWRYIEGYNSMVSCQKGRTCHAYAWQIGPFWQDTLELWTKSTGINAQQNTTTCKQCT